MTTKNEGRPFLAKKQSSFANQQETDTAPGGGGEFRRAAAIAGRSQSVDPTRGSAPNFDAAADINADRNFEVQDAESGGGTNAARGVRAPVRPMPFSTGPRTRAFPPDRPMQFQDNTGQVSNSVIPAERGEVFETGTGSQAVASDGGGSLVQPRGNTTLKVDALTDLVKKTFAEASAPRNETTGQSHGVTEQATLNEDGSDSAPGIEKALGDTEGVGARNSIGTVEHIPQVHSNPSSVVDGRVKSDGRELVAKPEHLPGQGPACPAGKVLRNGKCVSAKQAEDLGMAVTVAEEADAQEKAYIMRTSEDVSWGGGLLDRIF